MSRPRAFLFVIAGLAIGGVARPETQPAPERVQAFVGARIIDGKGGPPVAAGTLLVRDGRIEAVGGAVLVPAGVERIDVRGKTLIPGLVNTHGHVGETKGLRAGPELYSRENVLDQLGVYARYGVTSVFSLGGDQDPGFRVRDEQETASLARARLHVAGPVVVAATPEEARIAVDHVADMGADLVKIRVDDFLGTAPKMSAPVYQAVIDEAHKRGLRLAVHLFYLDDAKGVLRAGADFIAHSVRDQDVDNELVALLRGRNLCLCPTLTREVSSFVYGGRPDFFDDPFFLREADPAVLEALLDPKRQEDVRKGPAERYRTALAVASRNLKRLSDAGVRIAFGTDSGPPARFQGYFEHLELELMVKAGLTPMQALVSATGDAARCMHVERQVGTLVPGAWADFVVLGANPLDDIKNTRAIESVWIAGNRVPARP